MIAIKIAVRSILRRKKRMISIGALVVVGTLLIVFGQTFSGSAERASREAIIDHFTGDFIVYSERANRAATPFSFTSPLPILREVSEVTEYLSGLEQIETFVPFAQNYAVIQIDQEDDEPVELPFVFYGVEPERYRRTFRNVEMVSGSFFGVGADGGQSLPGILLSEAQLAQYADDFGISLEPGRQVTMLSVIGGGSVNAVETTVRGVFQPRFYENVFDYINFMDFSTYSDLFNYTGVRDESLPPALQEGFESEEEIFALGEEGAAEVDVEELETEQLSGYTLIAVKLTEGSDREEVMQEVRESELPVSVVPWDEASGGFAQIASALQTFIYIATGLIFLIVVLIFMNTLIINVIERTGEIGTIRAIGGERSLVTGIFVSETLILNGVSALVGMALGLVAIVVATRTGVPLPDVVAQFLVGGGRLPLQLTAWPFLQAAAIIVAVSIIATLYPVAFASRISPVRAMEQR